MNTFDFNTQLVMSAGVSVGEDIGAVLLAQIPGALKVIKANTRDDKSGTDYWIEHKRGTPVSVDTKIRTQDPIQTRGRDDLALETWSVVGKKIGWTLDETKRTDYVLWWFKPTRRWALLPFLQLQAVFKKRQDEWEALYGNATKERQQHTSSSRGGWNSECLFVPRRTVWAAIYEDFGGAVTDTSLPQGHAAQKHAGLAAPRVTSDDLFESTRKRPNNQCDRCDKFAAITLLVEDCVGKRIICSACWKELHEHMQPSARRSVA